MGFFNAMSSIGKMNNLLRETENKLNLISIYMEKGAPKTIIEEEVIHLKGLQNQMGDVLANSAGARVATYSFLGKKCKILDVLMFLKQIIQDLDHR